jgi:flotillin
VVSTAKYDTIVWQIDDFAVAYRKLDFTDTRDPLGIVNAQLREQAEAAIKDKIATMSVEEVLTDKAPIIEELTARLKAVTEGRQGDETTVEGLGIKIVTVQIREALVSSEKLWQDLQAPFRHQQEKTAHISYLMMQDEIRQKELEARQAAETSEAETMVEIERIKQSKQTEALELKLTEESIRFTREQETIREKTQLEEETTVTKRESEQRLQMQAARMEQERKLAALRQAQREMLEQARLDTEAGSRQKTLQN